ncbi:ABC transporter permease [Tengunoibacter tsumagoiensis]|uniref:ABC transporter permease n=1 Tax=Tengunoibacter tsumagoiensis TaxID=2014871 RepID=A0A402A767_9CHLR|nr:ABC transporter permease [Tengunoibacter tsumagoiensis]GCE14876.1 ABC transporter permease [Tengunoibacter tsumagoiensis]
MLKQSTPADAQEKSPSQQSNVIISSDNAARHSLARNVGLIIEREYKGRVNTPTYRITTIIILILMAIGICVPTFLQYFLATSNSQTQIGLVNNVGSVANMSNDDLVHYMNTSLNGGKTQNTTSTSHFVVTAHASNESSDLQKKVKDGSLPILLVLDRPANQDLHITLYNKTNTTSSNTVDPAQAQVQALVEQLNLLDKSARLGLTSTQAQNLFAPADLSIINTYQSNLSESDSTTALILSMAGVVLIFMSVFMYGAGVAQGVAEEKGNRIVEILVNAATPLQLMIGKIIGIGLAGLTQMVCLVAVAIGVLLLQTPLKNALLGNATAASSFNLTLTGSSLTLLLFVLIYFVLGFILFATLFAAVGALVNRQDEVQSAISPLTWLFTTGYVVSFFAVGTPQAAWVKVISYIPFWTPTVMLVRIASQTAFWWEIVLSILLMIVSNIVCAIIAARIYRFGILMYGQKLTIRQALTRISRS